MSWKKKPPGPGIPTLNTPLVNWPAMSFWLLRTIVLGLAIVAVPPTGFGLRLAVTNKLLLSWSWIIATWPVERTTWRPRRSSPVNGVPANVRVGFGADAIAVVGENRKMVVFSLGELPELGRGQGVTLQRYRDGGLSDATAFSFDDGLSWALGGESGRTRTETDLSPWRAARGAAGRMPPIGFPRNNRFG